MLNTKFPVSTPLQNGRDCALLVVSCDAYSDLWKPFFTLLDRNWPDCPYTVYLGSGSQSMPGVTALSSQGGRDWSRCMIDYLMQLEQDYILVMLDDFFLRRPVCTNSINAALEFARRHDGTMVRLIPRPGPTSHIPGSIAIGECAAGMPYRLCLQASIWQRSRLLSLLRPGESIWQFELNANERSRALPFGFYCAWEPLLPYEGLLVHHVVEKGRWFAHEKWIFGRQDIGCDFSRRAVLPWKSTLVYHMAAVLERMLSFFQWQTKMQIKSMIKSLLMRNFSRTLVQLRTPE